MTIAELCNATLSLRPFMVDLLSVPMNTFIRQLGRHIDRDIQLYSYYSQRIVDLVNSILMGYTNQLYLSIYLYVL